MEGPAGGRQRVGGIQDQIVDGRDGLLVPIRTTSTSSRACCGACSTTPSWPRGWSGARARVLEEFLGDRHLEQYVDLFAGLVAHAADSHS